MTQSKFHLATISTRLCLIVIIIIAVSLRVGMAVYLGDHIVNLPGIFDQVSYDMVAQRVLSGEGFTVAEDWWPATSAGEPTAHWSYLYTLYLSAIYGFFGHHPLIARLTQSITVGILLPWLLFRVGRYYFDERIGLVSAGLSAIYIYFVYYSAALVTESFYIISILWILDLAGQLSRDYETASTPKLLILGFWLGLALAITVLLRQVFLLFIPILFIWLLWRSYKQRLQATLPMIGVLVIAAFMLVASILPWTYRNYRAFDTFVLLNTNAGFAFFWGNHPIHGYNFISILPAEGPSYYDLLPKELLTLNEAELDRALLKEAMTTIQADPVRYLILSLSRIKDYFEFWPSANSSTISNLSRILSFGFFLPFMLYGLIRGLHQSLTSEQLILYLFIISYTGIHLMTWALIRYRLPVDAVFLVFAGVAFVEVGSKIMTRQLNLKDPFE